MDGMSLERAEQSAAGESERTRARARFSANGKLLSGRLPETASNSTAELFASQRLSVCHQTCKSRTAQLIAQARKHEFAKLQIFCTNLNQTLEIRKFRFPASHSRHKSEHDPNMFCTFLFRKKHWNRNLELAETFKLFQDSLARCLSGLECQRKQKDAELMLSSKVVL